MGDKPFSSPALGLRLIQLTPDVRAPFNIGQLVAQEQNLPLINTQVGSIFDDRFDPNLRWYIPTFALVNVSDPAFAFDAVQAGVGEEGNPFNRAALTLDLRSADPDDVRNAHAENTSAKFQTIPLNVNANLTLPFTANDGSLQTATAIGQIVGQEDGTQRVTFNLQGPDVINGYLQLTQLGNATITLLLTYDAWRRITRIVRRPSDRVFGRPIDVAPVRPPPPDPPPDLSPVPGLTPIPGLLITPGLMAAPNHMAVSGQVIAHDSALLRTPVARIAGGPFMPPGGWEEETEDYYVSTTGQDTQKLAVGLTFQIDVYRPRYTITASGTKRPIIDIHDLTQFATPRSEYRELTSLGDVQSRYPSLRRLYIGQVSGTVVAIPASYGIVRGSAGTAAHCEAVVDPSPTSVSGCRFQFTFTVAPAVDPIDLAQLALDLPGIPEAANGPLQLTLPAGLDPRTPATLSGFPAATAAFTDGVAAHTLLVGVTIADDQATPAITNVSLFLNQLTVAVSTPLFGTVALRLDDLYTPPVQTSVLLNIRATADSDDVAVSIGAGVPPAVVATNHAPFDLQLLRSAVLNAHGLAITPLGGTTLASGQSTTLPGDATGAIASPVTRTLALPSPLPKAALFNYISFHTATVQQVQHALTVDAMGVSFAAAGITQLDIHFKIASLVDIPIPSITLTGNHAIDFVHVLVPVDALLTGLTTAVTISITAAAGGREVSLTHDFLDDPIFSLSSAQMA